MKTCLALFVCFGALSTATAKPTLHFLAGDIPLVSASGKVVVGQNAPDGSIGFRYTLDGGYEGLPFTPSDVNHDGSVIVGAAISGVPYIWENGVSTALVDLPQGVFVTSMKIAAYSNLAAATTIFGERVSFTWDGEKVTLLPSFDNRTPTVLALSGDGSKIVADPNLVYQNNRYTEYENLHLTSISDDGTTLVGASSPTWSNAGAFLNSSGLHTIPGPFGTAKAASDGGLAITGDASFPDSGRAPGLVYYWSEATGLFELQSLVPSDEDALLVFARDISADGSVVVGEAFNHDGSNPRGFMVTGLEQSAIPEPSSYGAIAALGLVGTIIARSRRRRRYEGVQAVKVSDLGKRCFPDWPRETRSQRR